VGYFWVRKKVHWSDTDAAGIAWFANYFRWFEDAEEELFAAVTGRSRQALLDEQGFGMPRVEASARYQAPVRAGQTIKVGIVSTVENSRRLRHDFQIRDDATGALLADGFVRVACVDAATFAPRDLPDVVSTTLVGALPAAADRQARGQVEPPWT
jgi:acyl-CoA thioester hydrolase